MHIALFGGSFDPPHLAHQRIPLHFLENKIVDEVWCVPTQDHPFHKKMTPSQQRVEMLEMLDIPIEYFEVERGGPSYSYDTLDALSRKYPQHTFSWIIGADNVKSFPLWHKYTEVLSHFHVFVYPREGYAASALLDGMTFLKDLEEVTVSSTEVRQKVRDHESITELVHPEIEKYIKTHALYQST